MKNDIKIRVATQIHTRKLDRSVAHRNMERAKLRKVNKHDYVTYYRYRTRSYISGTTKTAWSSTQNDKDLLNAGYVLTGNKKEITQA